MADTEDLEQTEDDLIKEAREMGWRPEGEYKGKAPWVDAATYVDKGRHVLPIMAAHTEKLKADNLTKQREIDTLKSELETLRKDMEGFKEDATNKQIVEKRADLTARLKQAREDEDVDAEVRIQTELQALNAPAAPKKVEPSKKQDDGVSPEFKAWNAANPWFGDESNPENEEKTDAVLRAGKRLRREGNTLTGAAFMDKAVEVYEASQRGNKGPDKYEGGNNNDRGSRGAKTFSSLPAAAKQACLEDADALVGPNKKFKDLKDWQAEYARVYYENE